MHDQTNNIIRTQKIINGTNLEENNKIATMFAQCLHILKLFIEGF